MEFFTEFILGNAEHAHYWIFFFLMLAGLNLPISEDLMIIISGTLASTVIPEHTILLFVWTFLGCYLSDWEAYWIGRLLGPKLWEIRWLSKTVRRGQIRKINRFYENYGFLTLMIGRFIPFGVRNCLFITAGMGRMPFPRFLFADGLACFISNLTLFTLAFWSGKNYHLLYEQVLAFNSYLFGVAAFFIAIIGIRWWRKPKKEKKRQVV